MRKTIPVCGQYGVIKDQPAWELPINAWSDASNVSFRGGSMQRIAGQAQVFDTPSVTPYFIAPYQTATSRYWIHIGIASAFADDGTARTEITGTPFTGTSAYRFSGGVLNGIFGCTNGLDLPVYWDGNTANNFATLPGWDSNELCGVLAPFKNYWVALDITKSSTRYPYMMKWSDAAVPGANPTTWDETDVEEDAGEQDLGETGDTIVDAKTLGNSLIIYKQNSRVAATQTFDARIFSFQRLPGNLGAMNKGCVAETPLGHMVFGNGDIYVHNGGEPQSLCDGTVRETIFEGIESQFSYKAFAVANPAQSEVWFCYPESGEAECSVAAVYNWTGKTWTFRDLPDVTYAASGLLAAAAATIDEMTDDIDNYIGAIDSNPRTPASPRLIMTTTAPRIDLADSGGTFAGTAFTSSVERKGLVLDDDPSTVKLLTKIVPRIESAAGTVVLIEAGGSMSAEEEPEWTFSYSYTVGTDREAYGFATGKFLSLRISSTDAHLYKIKSMDLEYEIAGGY
jgi:hypothetical protein